MFLKKNGLRPQQVQDFIPTPLDVATTMYHTGLDPITLKPVYVAKGLRDKKTQRSLMQFFRPENYFVVREALEQEGRQDLIGTHRDALIPPYAPKEALQARKAEREKLFERGQKQHSRGA